MVFSFRNANHGIIHLNSSRFKRDARDLDEDEEIWFDREDDEDMSTVSPQNDEKPKPNSTQKFNDIDMIDTLKRTTNNSVVPTSPTIVTQPTTIKKITDSPPKATPLASLTSITSSVNSRKVRTLFDYHSDTSLQIFVCIR